MASHARIIGGSLLLLTMVVIILVAFLPTYLAGITAVDSTITDIRRSYVDRTESNLDSFLDLPLVRLRQATQLFFSGVVNNTYDNTDSYEQYVTNLVWSEKEIFATGLLFLREGLAPGKVGNTLVYCDTTLGEHPVTGSDRFHHPNGSATAVIRAVNPTTMETIVPSIWNIEAPRLWNNRSTDIIGDGVMYARLPELTASPSPRVGYQYLGRSLDTPIITAIGELLHPVTGSVEGILSINSNFLRIQELIKNLGLRQRSLGVAFTIFPEQAIVGVSWEEQTYEVIGNPYLPGSGSQVLNKWFNNITKGGYMISEVVPSITLDRLTDRSYSNSSSEIKTNEHGKTFIDIVTIRKVNLDVRVLLCMPESDFMEGISRARSSALAGIISILLLILFVVIGIFVASRAAVRDTSSAPKDESKPFAVMFTDVQASTTLWSQVPDEMGPALDTHHEVIRRLIKKHKGYEVKTIGDAFLIVHTEAEALVRLAEEIQEEFLLHDWGTTAFDDIYRDSERDAAEKMAASAAAAASKSNNTGGESQAGNTAFEPPTANDPDYAKKWNGLRVRVGVHFGNGEIQFDEVAKGYDYYGNVVNTASRVESSANGGQVIISAAALNQLRSSEHQNRFKNMGAHALRGVQEPIELFQLEFKARNYKGLSTLTTAAAEGNNDDDADGGVGEEDRSDIMSQQSSINDSQVNPQYLSQRYLSGITSPHLKTEMSHSHSFLTLVLSSTPEKERKELVRKLGDRWRVDTSMLDRKGLGDRFAAEWGVWSLAERVTKIHMKQKYNQQNQQHGGGGQLLDDELTTGSGNQERRRSSIASGLLRRGKEDPPMPSSSSAEKKNDTTSENEVAGDRAAQYEDKTASHEDGGSANETPGFVNA